MNVKKTKCFSNKVVEEELKYENHKNLLFNAT